MTKPPLVIISRKFIEQVAMPLFEEGLKKKQERAFALFGSFSKDRIEIKSWKKVSEKDCGHDYFLHSIPKRKDLLGYLHTHPALKQRGHVSYKFCKTWLSEGDYSEMTKRREKICGICVLPIDHLKYGIIQAAIVFWGIGYPILLSIKSDDIFSPHVGLQLHRFSKNKWKIMSIEKF